MLEGIGIDIVQNARIKLLLKKHPRVFLQKFFHDSEFGENWNTAQVERIAGRVAAKEAVIKATSGFVAQPLSFLDIRVEELANGAPRITLMPKSRLQNVRIFVSISHAGAYAVAMAFCQKIPKQRKVLRT